MKNWETKKLGELSKKKDAVVSGPFGSNLKVSDYKAKGIPILRLQNIGKGYFIDKDIKYISEQKAEELKYHSFISGDIALAKLGIPIGKTCTIPNHLQAGIITADVVRIRPNKNMVNYNFLEYFLNSDLSVSQLTGNISGATRPRVNLSDVRNIEIPIPPLPEQQRIVSILDECFAAIDKAKANAEQNLKNAKELFESYLQGVFENGNWETKTLNQIAENLDNKRVPITKNKRESGDIPYYGASGIVDYVADYLFDEDLLCVSEDGANLLARTYPIAFSISGKTWVNNHAHVLRFPNLITQKFVEVYINSIKIDDFVSGMAQPKLNQAMLNKIPIPFPSIEEQQIIVRQLDALRAETQKLEAVYQKKKTDLEELKKSILQKAFTGELETENAIAV
jgi:type I restriction enzyme S subunit